MKQLQATQIEWSSSHPIHQQLPYRFPNGVEFKGVNARCGQCGADYAADYMRGTLSTLNQKQCLMVAKGFCGLCNTITCFNFLIDGSAEPKIMDLGESQQRHSLPQQDSALQEH